MLGTIAMVLLTFCLMLVALWLAAGLGRGLYDEIYRRWRTWRVDQLGFREHEQEIKLAGVRVLRPDGTGRAGIAWDGKIYRDLDTRAVFSQEVTLAINPVLEMLRAQHSLLLAMRAGGGGRGDLPDVDEITKGALTWPDVVRLPDLFTDRRPSLDRLVIGAYPTSDGLDTVSLSLHRLMHTLVVGASGWGKSTWLRSLLWQVALAPEPIEVVAVDTSGSEFNLLHDWGKLRYPVARTTSDAIGTLQAVSDEIERRKGLYERYPVVTKLTEYNIASGDVLPPWLVVTDEGTNLLNQAGIGEYLRAAVQTSRQYGIYVLVAGQSANHKVLPTQTRDNFSTRLCCRTSPTSSRVVLDDKAASDITHKGRFFAQLEGQALAELQGPFVTRDEFLKALTNGGPAMGTPQAQEVDQDNDKVQRVLSAYEKHGTKSGASREAFGSAGGNDYYQTVEILKEHGKI